MIVVGSYGEAPLKGALIGSTAHKLLHLSERPVLVVRCRLGARRRHHRRRGRPRSCRSQERPGPGPGPGQVAIDVRAAGVNFADTMARVGLYPDAPKLPAVVGYEVAGTVRVARRRGTGERVMAGTHFGGYAVARRGRGGRRRRAARAAVVRAGRGDPGQLRHRVGRARRATAACRRASAC